MISYKSLISCLMVLIIIAFGSVSTYAGNPINLKISLAEVKGSRIANFYETFAAIVKEKTKDSVIVRVYPGGVLSSQDLPPIQSGVADMLNVALGTGVAKTLLPFTSISWAFYLIEPGEHSFRVFNSRGEFMSTANKVLKQHNLRFVGAWNVGTRHITANKPILTPADIVGLKLRSTPTDFIMQMWRIMGASPTPVPITDLQTALLTKVVDAQENPVTHIKDYSLYEVQKYLSYTAHQLSMVVLVINNKSWESLDSHQQQALEEALGECSRRYEAETTGLNEQAKTLAEKHGMKFIGPEQGLRRDLFQEKAKEIYAYFQKDWGEWTDKILKMKP